MIFISYTSDSILYMKTMNNLDYMPPMVIGDDTGFSDPSFIPAVADIAQGAMNRSAWDIGKPGSTTYKINEMYKAKTGRDLDDTSARNMQSFFALADAINRAGSTEPEKIRDALSQDRSQARAADDGLQRRKVRSDRTEHRWPRPISSSSRTSSTSWYGRRRAADRQARLADEGLEAVGAPPGFPGTRPSSTTLPYWGGIE